MSMFSGFNLPSGFNLNALAGLFGGAAPSMNPGQAYAQARRSGSGESDYALRERTGVNAAYAQYEKELKQLQDQAGRASRLLIANSGKNPMERQKYTLGGGFGDATTSRENSILFKLAGPTGGIGRGSKWFQDMLPFVDRYNQLRGQFEGLGLNPDNLQGFRF